MIDVVRVWIGHPYENGNFNGTAFFINENILVTAKHVVVDRNNQIYNELFITDTDDGGVIPILETILCQRDLAMLKVKKSFKIGRVNFTKEIQTGDNVEVFGFYDKDTSQKGYENRISGYQSFEHTYELQSHLTKGLSGSPVMIDKKVCGVTTAINSSKNITYMIPITELCMKLDYTSSKSSNTNKVSTKLYLSYFAKVSAIIASFVASYVAVGNYMKNHLPPPIEPEMNNLPYVCYETRQEVGTHKVYEGCSEERVGCNLLYKEKFGKYPTIKGREMAFHSCKNSVLNHDLRKNVCYDTKSYVGTQAVYFGCVIEKKKCSELGKEHFGWYPTVEERNSAIKRCKS